MKELIPFENELVELMKNIKFRKIRNTFQEKLKEDIKFTESNKTKTSADNASNSNIKKQINMAGKNLLRDKEVIKQMETNREGNRFITIKDHKENFDNQPTVQLINPAKNELGRISKLILDKINTPYSPTNQSC